MADVFGSDPSRATTPEYSDQRVWSMDAFSWMLEQAQDVTIPRQSMEEISAAKDRRFLLMYQGGCVGMSGACSWTAKQLEERKLAGDVGLGNLGPGAPPLDQAYASFDDAAEAIRSLEAEMQGQRTSEAEAQAEAHHFIVLMSFNTDDLKTGVSPAEAFQTDGATGRVDMSAYEGHYGENVSAPLYDFGIWDPQTNTVWHADQGGSGQAYQSAVETFLEGYDRTAYLVVESQWFDPGKGPYSPDSAPVWPMATDKGAQKRQRRRDRRERRQTRKQDGGQQ